MDFYSFADITRTPSFVRCSDRHATLCDYKMAGTSIAKSKNTGWTRTTGRDSTGGSGGGALHRGPWAPGQTVKLPGAESCLVLVQGQIAPPLPSWYVERKITFHRIYSNPRSTLWQK